ncbi:Acyl carrier protein [Rickettsiales endosymbiont of Paramecium tredecaurelia]|uniref:acyl carrier protein n=1 Tax=Candidatus Sarmatiella mevalonica TaxID=2770581 RepID=UPI001921D876|nr:acyl carrier protein [Candidatus Sarmatiella mevalonica]MBL3284646.1 Acyl carrier protein [Candidatus Sarmatiella mevalonica]
MSINPEISRDEIKKQIIEIVTQTLKDGPREITEGLRFSEDLNADSLDQVEFILAVESRFSCNIPDEDAERIKTVGNAIEYIYGKLISARM